MAIEQGQQAPDFDLAVTGQERVTLAQFRGEKNVLLVFHPFAFTGICESEAGQLRDNIDRYREADVEVVFVSCDAWPTRQAFKEQLGADYTFASDFWPHGEAAKAYGVFNEQAGAALRGTFLIGKDGTVLWTQVNQPAEERDTLVEDSLAAASA
jgi:peroxiredoxin (alkyl hydroperoxide reductase subunit C)